MGKWWQERYTHTHTHRKKCWFTYNMRCGGCMRSVHKKYDLFYVIYIVCVWLRVQIKCICFADTKTTEAAKHKSIELWLFLFSSFKWSQNSKRKNTHRSFCLWFASTPKVWWSGEKRSKETIPSAQMRSLKIDEVQRRRARSQNDFVVLCDFIKWQQQKKSN